MSRRQKDPLRTLTAEERKIVEEFASARSERADVVARAKVLKAIAQGARFQEAARAAGRHSDDAVAHLVARFNREGIGAVWPRYGGGPPPKYGPAERERIIKEARRAPDREQDGTANWSLTTLQRALRRAPDGLTAGEHLDDLADAARGRLELASRPKLVRDGQSGSETEKRHRGSLGPRGGGEKRR
jgi:hypothetical protein